MKRNRVKRNWALRNELIAKGHIIPRWMVSSWLRKRGFVAAAEAIEARGK